MASKNSILKSPQNLNQAYEEANRETPDQRNRRVALYHAHKIQAVKDVQNQIFEAIEAFLDFPLAPGSSSSQPDPADAEKFQEMIRPFQPSDYDDLLDERRMADRCGYIFCPNRPKKQNTVGKYKILGKKQGQDFKVVEAQKLNLWCSPECARRALYVKVQLIEEPAWLRIGDEYSGITLLRGDDSGGGVKNDEDSDNDQLKQAMDRLAIERGDKQGDTRPADLVKENVVENEHTKATALPTADSHIAIEGYEPQAKSANSTKLPLRPK